MKQLSDSKAGDHVITVAKQPRVLVVTRRTAKRIWIGSRQFDLEGFEKPRGGTVIRMPKYPGESDAILTEIERRNWEGKEEEKKKWKEPGYLAAKFLTDLGAFGPEELLKIYSVKQVNAAAKAMGYV